MHQCPKSRSEDVHRSRPKTQWESWRKEITGKLRGALLARQKPAPDINLDRLDTLDPIPESQKQ